MKTLPLALLGLAGLTLAGCGGDGASSPSQAATRCLTCHAIKKDGRPLSGPSLYGIIGKPAASVAGFTYSDALKNSGVVWTEDKLDAFIENPNKLIPGTRMSFGGESDPAKRKAIIDAIKAESAK